jgi:serine/threonine protein kinase
MPSPIKRNKFIIMNKVMVTVKTMITTEDFKWHRLLGKGSFGEVYLASMKSSDSKLYAVKVLDKAKVFSKNLTRYA